jgi:hypothetical protein
MGERQACATSAALRRMASASPSRLSRTSAASMPGRDGTAIPPEMRRLIPGCAPGGEGSVRETGGGAGGGIRGQAQGEVRQPLR